MSESQCRITFALGTNWCKVHNRALMLCADIYRGERNQLTDQIVVLKSRIDQMQKYIDWCHSQVPGLRAVFEALSVNKSINNKPINEL